MTDWVYDIECFPNVFLLTAKNVKMSKSKVFEISPWNNDRRSLARFINKLKKRGDRMIGFNNIGYDYPVLHHLLINTYEQSAPKVCVKVAWQKTQDIINTSFDNRFAHMVWESDHIAPQIDLMKVHHFDNPAKATSLKLLEFNMRSNDVRELPFEPGTVLVESDMETLRSYNMHDVNETIKFYHNKEAQTKDMIRFREALSGRYDKNMVNYSDTKIGTAVLVHRLEESLGPNVCYYYDNESGKRITRQTPRQKIIFDEIILDNVSFERPEFNAVLDWFKQKTITQTKGALVDIPESELGELSKYCGPVKKSGVLANLNCFVDGFEFVFGTGGIHGSVESQCVQSDKDHMIIDADVTSLYPSIAIVNGFYPEHLSEAFVDIYAELKDERNSYDKGTPENAMLKLALNGTYGNSNSQYSPFYDPKFTMSITINGQLQLCMLAEALLKVEGLELIQINTDGVTVRIPRSQHSDYLKQCQQWMFVTGLDLEFASYKQMFIRDVNNYIAEYENGKVKRKGAYEYELGFHQNHSALVVPKVTERVLLHGEDPVDMLYHHDDVMDFMLRTKVPKSSRLVGSTDDWLDIGSVELQNITRYYISNEGVELTKIMPPLARKPGVERRIGINIGWKVTPVNQMRPIDFKTINQTFYFEEVMKLVRPVLPDVLKVAA